MAKYTFEFKKNVVQAYLNGKGRCDYLAKKYEVGSVAQAYRWVKAYESKGTDGLARSRKNKNYSFDFKLHIVKLYLTTEISYQKLALSIGMNNPSCGYLFKSFEPHFHTYSSISICSLSYLILEFLIRFLMYPYFYSTFGKVEGKN